MIRWVVILDMLNTIIRALIKIPSYNSNTKLLIILTTLGIIMLVNLIPLGFYIAYILFWKEQCKDLCGDDSDKYTIWGKLIPILQSVAVCCYFFGDNFYYAMNRYGGCLTCGKFCVKQCIIAAIISSAIAAILYAVVIIIQECIDDKPTNGVSKTPPKTPPKDNNLHKLGSINPAAMPESTGEVPTKDGNSTGEVPTKDGNSTGKVPTGEVPNPASEVPTPWFKFTPMIAVIAQMDLLYTIATGKINELVISITLLLTAIAIGSIRIWIIAAKQAKKRAIELNLKNCILIILLCASLGIHAVGDNLEPLNSIPWLNCTNNFNSTMNCLNDDESCQINSIIRLVTEIFSFVFVAIVLSLYSFCGWGHKCLNQINT